MNAVGMNTADSTRAMPTTGPFRSEVEMKDAFARFDVVAANPNAYVDGNVTNSIAANALTTAQGVGNTAFSATVRLQTGARVEKAFAPTPITTGGTSTLTVTVRNFNATPLTGIAFTDMFPGTMRVAAPVTSRPAPPARRCPIATRPVSPRGEPCKLCSTARKQPDLLPGDHCHRSLLCQPRQGRALGVLHTQSFD